MSPSQTALLLALVQADRWYRTRLAQGESVHPDWRGVEVGGLSGFALSTALSLERAGLLEMLEGAGGRQRWAFLGRYSAFDS